jgi:hypothetical protein
MDAVMANEIDPVKYGVLWERVQGYERRFDDMSAKIDKMENSVEKLVALANQGRGGFWAGMAEDYRRDVRHGRKTRPFAA